MKKDWSTLEKGDKLYLMIPYEDNGIIKYEFQESQVINTHQYNLCTNIRFKYTNKIINRRCRVNFCVNESKYNKIYLACCDYTMWAQDYEPVWGDIIVTYEDPNYINIIYQKLIDDKIKEQEALIESHQKFLNKIKKLRFEKMYDYLENG